jgi:serine protease Do
LGVQIQQWEPGLAEKFGLKEERGVLVGRVMEGEPAEKAGLKNGDVILELDGETIEDTRDLLNTVARLAPNRKVKVTVMRDGELQDFHVTLGERPAEGKFAQKSTVEDRLGLTVQEVTPELAKQLGLETSEGVLISNVKSGSPAAEAGLRRGDIIHEMEHQAVRSVESYREILAKLEKDSILLWIQRGKVRRYIVVHLEEE